MKKNIFIMYAIALLQGMVFYGPIATLYRQARGITVFDITFIESISYLLCIILEIPWGIIADKIGYKKTMVICSGLYFTSKLIFWRADSFGWFLLERVLLSVVCAGISGVDISILYLSAKKDESQKVFGVYNGLGTFAVLIKDNYDLAALLTVLSYGLAMILSLFLTEVKKSERSVLDFSEFNHLLKQSIKNKWALIFLLMVAIVTQTHQTVTVFLNQIQYEKCGMSASLIGYVYIVVVVGGILGVFSHRLTKKIGINQTGLVLIAIIMIACLILSLTDSSVLSVISILLIQIGHGLFAPYQTELQNQQITSSNRATVLSINAMIIDAICAFMSIIFGFWASIDLALAFGFGAMAMLISILVFVLWYRHQDLAAD